MLTRASIAEPCLQPVRRSITDRVVRYFAVYVVSIEQFGAFLACFVSWAGVDVLVVGNLAS